MLNKNGYVQLGVNSLQFDFQNEQIQLKNLL